jgi:hypothetical protein
LIWLFRDRPSGAGTQGKNTRGVGKKERVGEGGMPSTEIEISQERAA